MHYLEFISLPGLELVGQGYLHLKMNGLSKHLFNFDEITDLIIKPAYSLPFIRLKVALDFGD